MKTKTLFNHLTFLYLMAFLFYYTAAAYAQNSAASPGWESIFKQEACIQYDDAHLFPFTIRDYGRKLNDLTVEDIQAVRPMVASVSKGAEMTAALRAKFGSQVPAFNSHYSIQQSVALTVAATSAQTRERIQLIAPYLQWKEAGGIQTGSAIHDQLSTRMDNLQKLQQSNPLESYKIIDTQGGRSSIEVQIKSIGNKSFVIYRCQSTHRSQHSASEVALAVRGETLEANGK